MKTSLGPLSNETFSHWFSLKISAVKPRLNEQKEIESYILHVHGSNIGQWVVLSNGYLCIDSSFFKNEPKAIFKSAQGDRGWTL